MNGTRAFAAGCLLLLLVLQLWMFSGSFDKFFNHDSLFYMIHSPRSAGEAYDLLASPDAARQYRPLTLIFTALLKPLWGLDPGPYHWIPLGFHLLNTWLVYLLFKRLLAGPVAALAAAGFWGLHSVAGWITYDLTYLSDFMMASFLLGSLVLAVDGERKHSTALRAASLGLFAAALLTKESAITYPLGLVLCLTLAAQKKAGEMQQSEPFRTSFRNALPFTLLCTIISAAYAVQLIHWLQSGMIYTQGSAAAYNIDPWADLSSKAKYLLWALNLPEALQIEHPLRNRYLALALMGGVLALWTAHVITRRGRLRPEEWSGLLWFAGMNLPAMLLSHRLGKWYLYVPLIGLAMMFGSLAGRIRGWLPVRNDRAAAAGTLLLLLVPVAFSSRVQTRSFLASSDSSYASDVVKNCLLDLQAVHPVLPPEVTLYLRPTFEKNVADLFGYGMLYQLFYPDSRVEMRFADRGDALPIGPAGGREILILEYLYGHVYDVTEYYRERQGRDGRRLIQSLDRVQATVDTREFYPSHESFQTPGGTPVFFPTPERDIFTQIGGSTAQLALENIPPHGSLLFDIAWMFDRGDGAWAEIRIRSAGSEKVLYREYMKPNPPGKGLSWRKVQLDLEHYAGQDAELFLRCYNTVGKNTVADWLNWRDMRIVETPDAVSGMLSPSGADADRRESEGKPAAAG